MSLDTRTKKITGIISLKGVEYASIRPLLEPYLAAESFDYAFILHDMDHLEDGTMKLPHVHFCANFKTTKRLSTVLSAISNATGVQPLAITINKYESFSGCLQYLVHKNNPEKYHYDRKNIVTNIPSDEMDAFMEEDDKFDTDTLIRIVMSSPNKTAMIRTMGLGRYKLYRNVINDILQDLKGSAAQ